MLECGKGTERNLDKALIWYERAKEAKFDVENDINRIKEYMQAMNDY